MTLLAVSTHEVKPRENGDTTASKSHEPQENMAPDPVQARLNGTQRGHRPRRYTNRTTPAAAESAAKPYVAWSRSKFASLLCNRSGGRPRVAPPAQSRCSVPAAAAATDATAPSSVMARSEERRVGKEWRSRWSAEY